MMIIRKTRLETPVPKIGISGCLLGEKVRYDGKHKKCPYIIEQLFGQAELVPFCPEVAIGMGIPRPPIQLVEKHGKIRALGVENPDIDMTQALSGYANSISASLSCLSGFILKRNSPSCGIDKVKVLVSGNEYEQRGQGIFAKAIIQLMPDLPLIDEQQFIQDRYRQQFLHNINNYFQTHHQ